MSAPTPASTVDATAIAGWPSGGGRATVRMIADVARAAMIGAVEVVPGVSDGTIALIVGVYRHRIDGAGRLASGAALFVADGVRGRGRARASTHFRSVR